MDLAKKCLVPLSSDLIAGLKAAIKAGTKDSLNISGSSKHSLSDIGLNNESCKTILVNGNSTPKSNGYLSKKTSGTTNGFSDHQPNGNQNGISSSDNGHHEADPDNWDTGTGCMNPYGMLHESNAEFLLMNNLFYRIRNCWESPIICTMVYL